MIRTMAVMALAATLILGAFSISPAFAVEQDDVLAFEGKTKKVIVNDHDLNLSSKTKAEVGLQLIVDNVDEIGYNGQGRMALTISFSDQQNTPPIVFDPNENVFGYYYHEDSNRLTITETIIVSDSNETFILTGTGSYDLDRKDKSRADVTLSIVEIESQDKFFEIPVLGGIVLNPITS